MKYKIFFLLLFPLLLWAQSNKLDSITVQLQWKHQFEFAGFYAAKEKGFYKDVGLNVRFIEYENGLNLVDQVLEGHAEYGVGYSSIIADYYNDVPILMLANFFKQSPLVLITQKEITSPKELKNKTIMGLSDTIDNITLLQMLNKFGINSEDYTSVATDFNVEKFVNKEVDAMSVFITNETYKLNKLSIAYNVFNPAVFGVEYYDSNLFTSVKEIKEHPRRAKAFTNATIRGWEYALSHQAEIIELILKKYNTQSKTKEALEYEAKQTAAIMLPEVYPIGMIDKQRVQQIVNVFAQSGYIQKDVYKDLDNFIYLKNQAFYTTWSLYSYFHYLNTKLIWKIVFILLFIIIASVGVNIIRKRQNKILQHKINQAIQEQKEKDEIIYHQNKLISMGEMIENIAHQWRQPLAEINAIITSLDAYLEKNKALDAIVDDKFSKIETITGYMSHTINEFQEFYRPDKQKVSLMLDSVIASASAITQASLDSHKIKLHTQIKQTPTLYSYPNEIKQVLIIILNNAKDTLLQREIINPQIDLKVFQNENDVIISIEDNGGGIEEPYLDKIFEPYFTTKHKSKGTGLGLYMAKLITTESLQGVLSVSNTDKGALFKIHLKVIHE